DLYLQLDMVLDVDLDKLPMQVKAYKKVLGWWMPLPCEHDLGSCTFNDYCPIWPPFSPCPPAFKNLSICSCPLKANHYSMPMSKVSRLDANMLPSWLENGSYKARVEIFTEDKSETVLCIDFQLAVTS